LKNSPLNVLLIDRSNHHVFQPLLYQVATSVLAPGQIASPIRALLAAQTNTSVMLGNVTGISTASKQVIMDANDKIGLKISYDYLIIATGATHSYFGHDEFAVSPGSHIGSFREGRNRRRPGPTTRVNDVRASRRRANRRRDGKRDCGHGAHNTL
jgi:hypothetical protein